MYLDGNARFASALLRLAGHGDSEADSVSHRAGYLDRAVEVALALEARPRPAGFAFAREFGSAPAPLVVDGNDRAALFLTLLGAAAGDKRWLNRAREVLGEVTAEGVLVEGDAAVLARCASRLAGARSRTAQR